MSEARDLKRGLIGGPSCEQSSEAGPSLSQGVCPLGVCRRRARLIRLPRICQESSPQDGLWSAPPYLQ